MELVVYTGVEILVWPYLTAELSARGESVHVGTKVPNPRPDRLIRITAAGGGERALVLSTRTAIFECWDTSEPQAQRLAELSYAIMRAAQYDPSIPTVRKVGTVSAPKYFPDPESASPRYQFTLAIDVRGAVE